MDLGGLHTTDLVVLPILALEALVMMVLAAPNMMGLVVMLTMDQVAQDTQVKVETLTMGLVGPLILVPEDHVMTDQVVPVIQGLAALEKIVQVFAGKEHVKLFSANQHY